VVPVLDELGYPTEAAALDLLSRFIGDRIAQLGAHECLTLSGLAAFDGTSLCLLECDDGPVALANHGPFQTGGYTERAILVSTVVEYPNGRLVREHYGVTAVDTPAGARLALSRVVAGPDSTIDDAEARALISSFLGILAAGDFESAAGFLYNEGVGRQIHEEFGDAAFDPENLPALLANYCETACCDAMHEVLEPTDTTELSRTYHVRISHPDFGEYSKTFTVGAFEGHLTVDGLPLRLD
jgi:hypothetical protein